MTLPFTFYWANENETTFNPSTMNVINEDICSFEVKHDEGQIPTLDIAVRNPRIGLLAPGRKVWAWLAWQGTGAYTGTLVPLFFGVLVGVPTNLFQEKVTLQFIARSSQFIENKQKLAETMKAPPYYDAVFIEAGKRDDPDTILEGWSALWHIDRTSLAITASDILVGEDGTVTYDENHAIYNSVSLQLGQPPLTNVRVEASVHWTQRASGYFTVPTVHMASYTGDTLMSDWPKPGAGIGGGYKCEASFITDVYFISETPTTNHTMSWSSGAPKHEQCDQIAISQSSSGPALLAPNPLQNLLTWYMKSGICDPYGSPPDEPPVNLPGESSGSGVIIPLWSLAMDMTVRYDANRQFSEILSFDMTANVQGVLASPLVAQHTELLTLNGADVGEPLVQVLAWTDFSGRGVGIGTIIFPNNPTTAGGLSYQICVGAGTAGTTEPAFSDIPGVVTYDNGVLWSSLGTQSLSQVSVWSPGANVPLGQIMLLQKQQFNANIGNFEDVPGVGGYYICTNAGTTNEQYEQYSYTPPLTSNVEATPAIRHIDYIRQPAFGGTFLSDGSVGWTSLGGWLGNPIGGTADTVTASNYFPTSRGIVSTEYAISRARARLRFRSRAVTIGWECRFEDAVALSCRKNATLIDPRFPGGGATGKVIGYSLSCSGDGKIRGKVEIGCPIGYGGAVSPTTGTPQYAAAGYAQAGYDQYDGSQYVHGSGETTFSYPSFGQRFDDGLNIGSLRWSDVMDSADWGATPGLISGSLADQKEKIIGSFKTAQLLEWYLMWLGVTLASGMPGQDQFSQSGLDPTTAWWLLKQQLALITKNTPYVMAANPISWSALFKPCAGNGPFGGSYSISVSPLVVPQGINLEAPSA